MISPDLETDRKKYNVLEPILHKINADIVTISDEQKSRSQAIMETVVRLFIDEMKSLDVMFARMFRKILYGGSYYDGLKIKDADEFDIDLALALPKAADPCLEVSSDNGFVNVKLEKYESFKRQRQLAVDYSILSLFLYFQENGEVLDSDNYLLTDKFRAWFESLIHNATNNIIEYKKCPYKFTVHKGGPAFTLHINVNYSHRIDVDLVPSIIFSEEKWPGPPFRQNRTAKKDFLIVPKPFHDYGPLSWRLSFQEQESEIIRGKDRLKCVVRLLKLLRDVQGQDLIASYYIKTVFMWLLQYTDEAFWKRDSLSYTFMMGLKYYSKMLDEKTIPYYWNDRNNLLNTGKNVTIYQCSQRIKRIIARIERNLDSNEIATVLDEYFVLGKLRIINYKQYPKCRKSGKSRKGNEIMKRTDILRDLRNEGCNSINAQFYS
ncbi:hypothetical protein HHI36_019162 [Cryptolaemus montrouzieri]|uniref:Cyclic GMP-AMP synthase n=1 Tax=Cryptolaemus montrouzieri TaxID=559131 RepID=A0ABD2P354_9CUCU